MSKYYYLIAGLPNIAYDDSKLPYTVFGFKDMLDVYLTDDDKKLLDLFFLKIDNKIFLGQIQHPDYDPDTGGRFSYDEFNELINGLKREKEEEKPFINKNKRFPPFYEPFARAFLEATEKEEKTVVPWEDRLSALYYEYAMKNKNEFVADWFELNLNINNILTALTCRKYKFDNRANYIVGNNAVAKQLRTSNARDFDLGDSLEYLPTVLRLAEETDLYQREKKVDLLKWQWLDDRIFAKVFDIESVLAYLLKLEMSERWTTLDKATGEQAFRQLVGAMKTGSDNALEEFKRNNKK